MGPDDLINSLYLGISILISFNNLTFEPIDQFPI